MNKSSFASLVKKAFLALFATVALTLTAATTVFADPLYFIDSDSSGSESVTLSGANSADPDGALIDFSWRVNGVMISSGFGPRVVPDFVHNYSVGWSTVTLTVRDDVQVSSVAVIRVVLLPASANQPPVANAIVPGTVAASSANVASVFVNASSSSDPDGDMIFRYVWTEGATTLYDGSSATATFSLNGLGIHTVQLRVYSRDSLSIIQSGTRNFSIDVQPAGGLLAGRRYNRTIGQDFPFSDTYGEYAGITFNALTRTYFMTENALDKIFELQIDGTLIRTIDIVGLRPTGFPEADAEGISWIGGNKYVIGLQETKELIVATITPTTTSLSRSETTIIEVTSSGKPKGIAYNPLDNHFYWVATSEPKRVTKAQLNLVTGEMIEVWTKEVDNLPAFDLADIAFFPRLSPHPFLLSQSSNTIMETDLNGATAVLMSSYSLAGWDIPRGGGITFNHLGEMAVVGKRGPGAEDDFNVFVPTAPIPNQAPRPRIDGFFGWLDEDGDGEQPVLVRGSDSFDLDGEIVRYEWLVDGVKVAEGAGRNVTDLNRAFPVGTTPVTLRLYDNAQAVGEQTVEVNVAPKATTLPAMVSSENPAARTLRIAFAYGMETN